MKRFLFSVLSVLFVVNVLRASTPTITAVATSRAGAVLGSVAAAATSGGDTWVGTGAELLYVTNGGGSSITVTLAFGPGATIDGQTPSSRTVSIAAGASVILGPFPTNLYNDSTGNMNITYSAVTSVKIYVFRTGN